MCWVWIALILLILFICFHYIKKRHQEKLKSYTETFLCQTPKNELPMTNKEINKDNIELKELVNKWENTGGQAYINAEPLGLPPLVPIYNYKSYSFHPKDGPKYHRYNDPFDKNYIHKTYEVQQH